MIDIHGGSKDPKEARLSNFTTRNFMFDEVTCASIEGPLQAFKESDPIKQLEICMMSGKVAKRTGSALDGWKKAQTLWWKGVPYARNSKEYQSLLTRLYDAVYECDKSFRDDLAAVGREAIYHSIGKSDQSDTVLTEVEMIYQLNRLRIAVMREQDSNVSPLSAEGVPKYRGIKTDGDPVEYLQEHYREWLACKQLTQVSLRRFDEKLLNAVKYVLRRRNVKLASIVPPGIGQ